MTLHTTSLRAETAARSLLNSKVAICRQPSQLISSIEIHCQLIGADQVGMVMIRMRELRVGEHFWWLLVAVDVNDLPHPHCRRS